MTSLIYLKYFIVNYLPILLSFTHMANLEILSGQIGNILIIAPALVLTLSFLLTTNWILGVPPQTFFGYRWHYETAILYALFFMLNWRLIRKSKSIYESSVYTTLLTICAGYIYEIPYYLTTPKWNKIFADPTFPFLLSSRLIGTIYLGLMLIKYKHTPIKYTKLLLIVLLAFSALWYFNTLYIKIKHIMPDLFYRLPTMTYLTYLTRGIGEDAE